MSSFAAMPWLLSSLPTVDPVELLGAPPALVTVAATTAPITTIVIQGKIILTGGPTQPKLAQGYLTLFSSTAQADEASLSA